jgi:hypothetical protein
VWSGNDHRVRIHRTKKDRAHPAGIVRRRALIRSLIEQGALASEPASPSDPSTEGMSVEPIRGQPNVLRLRPILQVPQAEIIPFPLARRAN